MHYKSTRCVPPPPSLQQWLKESEKQKTFLRTVTREPVLTACFTELNLRWCDPVYTPQVPLLVSHCNLYKLGNLWSDETWETRPIRQGSTCPVGAQPTTNSHPLCSSQETWDVVFLQFHSPHVVFCSSVSVYIYKDGRNERILEADGRSIRTAASCTPSVPPSLGNL